MVLRSLGVVAFSVVLAACGGGGGGGGGGAAVNDGVFIDSAVQGVRFVTPTRSGFTDAGGTFQYLTGELVSFYIGDILLGSAIGDTQLTPIAFVLGATDETDPTVTNILRLVQTLDEDGNPANGIRITTAVFNLATGASIDFEVSIAAFENDGNVQTIVATLTAALGAARTLVDAATAQAHLRDSIGGGTDPGQYGSLDVSGPDTTTVRTPFEPMFAIPVGMPTGAVSWSEAQVNEGFSLTLSIPGDTVSSVSFIYGSGMNVSYSYQLVCVLAPTECDKISIDRDAQTATFDAVSLAPTTLPNNQASAPIVLDGTLSW